MQLSERLSGCLIGGAIGDAYGSAFENVELEKSSKDFYPFGAPEQRKPNWQFTDDTQLTLATCEAIGENEKLTPELLAAKFLSYFEQNRLTGIGASTLKALRELQVGGHWWVVGRKGEYAAGNGAAMRIAPIAFIESATRSEVKDYCTITHNNDEAYTGALAVWTAIRLAIDKSWTGRENLMKLVANNLPDTRVKDRLLELSESHHDLSEVGKMGSDGYVVNSVPLAIAHANKILSLGLEEMFESLINIGGDTDTNCSIAGQIAGALIGEQGIPSKMLNQLEQVEGFDWLTRTIELMK